MRNGQDHERHEKMKRKRWWRGLSGRTTRAGQDNGNGEEETRDQDEAKGRGRISRGDEGRAGRRMRREMQESGVTELTGVGVLAVSSCSRFLSAILCFSHIL